MTRMRDRIFAGFGAVLFFVTACALTVFVIIDFNRGSSKTSTQTQPDTATTCSSDKTETPLPVPEVYKATAPVDSLQVTDLEEGTGAVAKNGDCLVMKYYGTLATDGTKFDENFTTTAGFAFTLGAGSVIQGWDQGLVGIKEGTTRRLVIPASLGYGASGAGSIPANADLVFVVKLLRIQ